MNQKNKHFVIDTNVLIHNPGALYSFSDNTVVIPMTVIEELDKFKVASDKKGMHARQALREIDTLVRKGAINTGAKLSTGGTLKILFHPKVSTLPTDMDYTTHDNHILALAKDLQDHGEHVFFISKDVNARIKAEALNIKSRDYEKQKVEYASLYKGWRNIELPKQDIDLMFTKHELELKSLTLFANEYACIHQKEDPQKTVLARYDTEKKRFIPMTDNYEAMGIRPLNMEQKFAFDMLLNEKIQLVTMIGQAGTGKTLVALACGLQRIMGRDPRFEKMLVARPIIPMGKDIGYLPGTKDQKLNYWMQPIFDNLHYIMHKDDKNENEQKQSQNMKSRDKVDYLLETGMIEIEALTYIRGRSIPHQFIIIDEAQNLTPHEIKTIVSRAGEGTKIVLTGDAEQIDNPYLDANSNGLSYAAERLKNEILTGHIFLSKSERSKLASMAVELL